MYTLSLHVIKGHMFIQVREELLLLDTGAPSSFCASSPLTIADQQFELPNNYFGLSPNTLSSYVGVKTSGLLGADVLGEFDMIIETPNNSITLATDNLTFAGHTVPLEFFMGIPIILVRINSKVYRIFFDTGAQISYFQDELLTDFPPSGQTMDFYPGIGQFTTETHIVDLQIGEHMFSFRSGRLPELLGLTLMMAGTQGILGNAFLIDRKVGYFPRRKIILF
jgi:hypothetical protein